jgi:transposase
MDRYIGLDVHASSTTFAVVGASGKRLGSQVVETNGKALVECLKGQAGTLHVCFEEGVQSEWLFEVLSPHAAEVVVAGVGSSASRGQKDDARDAFGLAEQLRTGSIGTVVYKPTGCFGRLRQLCRVHGAIVRDKVRVQNRLKAHYRSRGIVVAGKEVYKPNSRGKWLEQLPTSSRTAVEMLYAEYDGLTELARQAEKELVLESHRHAISRVLETCPGLGPVRVAQLMATVVTPQRFRTRQTFWSYCGLGIIMRSSSDWLRGEDGGWVRANVMKTRGLSRQFNRTLKCVFKGAATTVIALYTVEEPLHRDYQRLLAAGTKPNLAKLTIARKIASTALAMWKSETPYSPRSTTKKEE